MKISKIKWKEHPILGDLELNFINPETHVPYDTIVLAGENGTGKTTILSSIGSFMDGYFMDHVEFIEYMIGEDIYVAIPPESASDIDKGFYDLILPDKIKLKMHTGKSTGSIVKNERIDNDRRNIRYYGCVFSKARADFQTNQITNTKTEDIDISKHDLDSKDDFSSLKQLIVDIFIQDRKKYGDLNEEKGKKGDPPMSFPEFEPSSKLFRFKKAFNTFFSGKIQFEGLSEKKTDMIILFSKNGNKIPIDNLSTGEKQIVFRGTYLLRNFQLLYGGIILVDEPEISMHPRWQKKLLQYYKDVFSNDLKEQVVQMFIATHSPAILADALSKENTDKVIVLECDDKGVIKPGAIETPLVLDGLSSAEVNYQAFKVASTDYHNALYGYIEAEGWKTDLDSSKPKVPYKKLKQDGTLQDGEVSPSEKIRHMIHHPENHYNGNIEDMGTEIEESIKTMRDVIKSKKEII